MNLLRRSCQRIVYLLSYLLCLCACADSPQDNVQASQDNTSLTQQKQHQAQQKQPQTRHKQQQVQYKQRQARHIKVPNVWVYTSAFAKRFGMSEVWIDDDLRGAEAVAYRIDWNVYGSSCGYFSEIGDCRPSSACVLDFYIPVSAGLLWNTTARYDSYYRRKASELLTPQYPHDEPGYISRLDTHSQSQGIGLDAVAHRYGIEGNSSTGSLFMLEFDRDMYQGLEYFSSSTTCGAFGRARHVKTHIYRPAVFNLTTGTIDFDHSNIAHTITIPDSFMQRVEIHDDALYSPGDIARK